MNRRAVFILLAVACGLLAFGCFTTVLQSVDYRGGQYHPIPREKRAAQAAAFALAAFVFWRVSRGRAAPPT